MRSALVLLLLVPAASGLPLALPCGLDEASCAVENGGFEEGVAGEMPPGWIPYVLAPACLGEGVALSQGLARTGVGALRVEDEAGECTGAVSEHVPVLAGVTYTAGFWARPIEGTPTARVFVTWYATDQTDVQVYLYKTPWQERLTTPDWREVAVTDAAPPGATHARVWIYAPLAEAGTFLVDDVRVVALGPLGAGASG